MVNKKRLIKLTQKLISINSENPPGDEFCIARFIKKYLNNLGIAAKIYEFKNRRSNVVAHVPGRKNNHSLLVTPHLDTVPAGFNWSKGPFAGKILNNRLYGLGATDCKGNLACALESIHSFVEEGVVLDYHLVFAATADEESGSGLGLIPLLDKGILKADAAIILDSDDFKIIVTQKGLIHFKVKIKGRRAHGAYPWRGVNAIDIALGIIKEIKAVQWPYARNKYLRPPTVNIGTIRGGDKVNVVADWCEFELDFRFLPGMQAKRMLRRIRGIIKRRAKDFKIEIEGIQAPYSISERSPLVAYLKQAIRKVKMKPIIEGSEGATVITFFQDKNIPAVATGFGSSGCAHTADEYVKIDNLYRGALVLEGFFKNINLVQLTRGKNYGRN